MPARTDNAVSKTHPASREILPDDPLDLTGVEVDGDPQLMLRLLVEEYARMGWGVDEIMRLAADPFYVGFHGLLRAFGEERLRDEITSILARCGVVRVKTIEVTPEPEPQLVELELPK